MSFTILGQKDAARPPRPLLLATIVAVDGDTTYLSTASSLGNAYLAYGGQNYQSRLIDENIDAIQAMSPQGLDIVPGMTLKIADADASIWTNHSNPHGWRGAAVSLTFILWDVAANAYSTDAITWSFIGESPSWAAGVLSMGCTSRANFQRVKVPAIPISRLCPWVFPSTAAQRASALNDKTSIYYQCGYSPDQAGGFGNQTTPNLTNPDGSQLTDASGNYVMCDYTRSCGNRTGAPTQGCMARLGNYSGNPVAAGSHTVEDGDITRDQSGRATACFGGITWIAPPGAQQGRQYTTGQWVTQFNQPNDSIFGKYWNQLYGEQWVDATVVNTAVDVNSLRGEAVVCVALDGPLMAAVTVKVNGEVVSQNNSDALFTWRWVNQGGRNGAVNGDAIYNGNGDPYGSLACLEFVVPFELASSGAQVSIQVQAQAAPILHYEIVGGILTPFYTSTYFQNPVWHLLDLIQYGNYTISQIDIQSFYDAAAICNANISFLNNNGLADTHSRYLSSFVLGGNQRQTLARVITGLRNNCGLVLVPNSATGLLQVFIEGTLADQQPAPIAGSNYNTPVASHTADGTAATGCLAYLFTEADYDTDSFKLTTRTMADTPNKVYIQFQDELNQFQTDSISIIDPDGYVASGNQEIDDQTPILGICNFDQGQRRGNTLLAKDLRGNDRDDAGGTEYIEFKTTMKAVHLASRPGLICGFEYQQLGWS